MKFFFKFIISLLIIVAITYLIATLYFHFTYPQDKWNWSEIDTTQTNFPKDFIWGTATAAHQIEGNNENTNWGEWEKLPNKIKDGSNAKIAVDGWNLAKSDIKLMKDLGVNSYRFSVAWNKIEPENDKFNEDALRHYDELINELLANNIQPMITLHHFTHPLWFEQLGAFEKEENIKHFVEFSKLVFTRYHDRVKYWVTLNEPNVFVTSAYFNTIFPPGNSNAKIGGEVLKNMLKSHVEVFRELKKIEVGTERRGDAETKTEDQRPKTKSQIGLATSIFQFEPYRRWHLGDWAIARITDNIFNETILGFFRTGTMSFNVPLDTNLVYTDAEAPQTLDFIGINYYSHFAYKFDFDFKKATQSIAVEGEEMTDMPYTIYTEGIYRAIRETSKLKKPIIITENGISDAKDDRRAKYIKQSLYAVSKAMKDGYDIRGYYYWTLLDNFEWAEGYTQKFGLYEVNLQTQERKLREGSKAFVEIINKK
ncbi:MAG: glycoside hydrolase family 1 protein [Pyrinomonadaceae bacterium]|jgi:beta-glucosidase|nr:glycoside hydrolase family 1 protein [Pyrinomonadaceae bacterium]